MREGGADAVLGSIVEVDSEGGRAGEVEIAGESGQGEAVEGRAHETSGR